MKKEARTLLVNKIECLRPAASAKRRAAAGETLH
jgi:hypothetical protein